MKWFIICLALIMVVTGVSAGPKWDISDDSWMQLSFLGQVHYSFLDNAADEEDFYLRRGRIILQGQIMDGVKFFMETDNDNAGLNGAGTVQTDIQDVWMDVRLYENKDKVAAWLQGGLILLPFSLENRSSAASLLGLDYNGEIIKFANSFVWRDVGAELHGHIMKRVAYRIGVFDGHDSYSTTRLEKNDDAALRFTGRLDVNLLGTAEQGGWFYTQDRRGGSGNYIVLGAGIDSQQKATATIPDPTLFPVPAVVEQDSDAWVVDVQSSFGIGEKVDILINGAYYDWDSAAFEGNTAFVEGGLLVYDKAMLTGKYSLQDPENGDEIADTTVGLHYFLKGHNARAGIEYRTGDSDDWTLFGVQFLL